MARATWEDDRDVRRIRIAGDLDHTGCERIARAVGRAAVEAPSSLVVVDLSAVRLLTGRGISLLLDVRRGILARGRGFLVAGLAPQARRVLATIGFLDAYPDCVAVEVA